MNSGILRSALVLFIVLAVSGCASVGIKPEDCPPGTQKLDGCPPLGAIDDPFIAELHDRRTWKDAEDYDFDPVAFARDADVPINRTRAKFIGSDNAGGLTSLAAKIHLIENAQHTLDLVYYIYRDDLVGLAILGALCDAVTRGVDIRIMVDSLGSFSLDKKWLKSLSSCASDAGFMRTADGELTIYRARVQVAIFNAASKIFVNHNRRSHDKLLVVDGWFGDSAYVMTGGRNISLAYYGILPDGSPNDDTYKDAEIFLNGGDAEGEAEFGVGRVSHGYYDLLFLFKNNKLLSTSPRSWPSYADEREQIRQSLEELSGLATVREYLDRMPGYVSDDFRSARVRLTHELTNLTNKNVTYKAVENAAANPNSVISVLNAIPDDEFTNQQVISPYLFAALYTNKDKEVVHDGAREALEWLDANPERTLDIVTNSAVTSDNFFAQAVIDMDLAPRLLLSEELQAAWLEKPDDSELNAGLVQSEAWQRMVNHPRLRIYETGRLDDIMFGGDVAYGKQHAKYIVSDDVGFVGTTNFDYRSRLYNNEMGFVFESRELANDIRRNTEYLISLSYRWGTPEWLEMRRRLMELKGSKATATRNQRKIYKTLRNTGLIWYF